MDTYLYKYNCERKLAFGLHALSEVNFYDGSVLDLIFTIRITQVPIKQARHELFPSNNNSREPAELSV